MFDMTELIISLMICGVPDVPLWGIEGAASIHYLILTTDSTCDRWALPYPVYRLETGDVDGDGNTDALVGVIKGTRFHPEKGRRLFIFKNHHGLVRPLWLGSKLGSISALPTGVYAALKPHPTTYMSWQNTNGTDSDLPSTDISCAMPTNRRPAWLFPGQIRLCHGKKTENEIRP